MPHDSGYPGSSERGGEIPRAVPRSHVDGDSQIVERKKWRCPTCRRRFRVLVGYHPTHCPDCTDAEPVETTDSARRQVLIEEPDPFIDFLASIAGHRITQPQVIKSALGLAIVLCTMLIGSAIVYPFWGARHAQVVETASPPIENPKPAESEKAVLEPPRLSPVVPLPAIPSKQVAVVPAEPAEAIRQPVPEAADADLTSVRSWIAANQDDPNWRLIKWWPPKPVDDDLVTYAGLLKTDRVARMRYRTTNSHGAPHEHDDVFVFRDDKVRAVPAGENWWWDEWGGWTKLIIQGSRRILPDGSNAQTPRLADSVKSLPDALPAEPVERPVPRRTATAAKSGSRQSIALNSRKHKQEPPWWARISDQADVDLVRDWLKNNQPGGQEIRWWKPRDFFVFGWSRSPHRTAVVPVDQFTRRFFTIYASGGLPPDRRTRERVCRFKFRNQAGTKEGKIEDRLFLVADGRVEPIVDSERKRREWRYFPESAGARPDSAE